MDERSITITDEDFDGSKGDLVRVDVAGLAKEFAYIGLWYACDRSEGTHITTLLANDPIGTAKLPDATFEEITENSFKKSPRKSIPADCGTLLIATRHEKAAYCRMKTFQWMDEKSFINYKVVRNRDTTIDTLKTGIIRGDVARFCRIGIEDGTGAVDYNDVILFLVLIKSLPPDDWKFDTGMFGVQKLPMLVLPFLFSVYGKYSKWFGQDPMEGIG